MKYTMRGITDWTGAKIISWGEIPVMAWSWKYGERQPQPPDDLPDDFTEEPVGGDEDEDDIKKKDAID